MNNLNPLCIDLSFALQKKRLPKIFVEIFLGFNRFNDFSYLFGSLCDVEAPYHDKMKTTEGANTSFMLYCIATLSLYSCLHMVLDSQLDICINEARLTSDAHEKNNTKIYITTTTIYREVL